MESLKGGYDYEFVSPPPKFLECSVCLLTLRDPHVISCCGNEFCQACIERVKEDGKPCPLCNEQNFTTMLHKKLVREVNALVIRCPQKELGCEWEGELGQLQRHLNPGAGVSSAQGCEFLMVECAYHCGAQLQRRLIQEHEMEACPKRPIEMQVASLMKKFEAIVIENQMLKQELDETKKMHQQDMDEVKQELGDLKQAHHQQREELRQAKEANENLQRVCDVYHTLAKEGPWAVHLTLGQDWGMGRYSRYHICERVPRQVTHAGFIIIVATIDFSLIQARLPIQSKGGHDTSPCIVECSCIKWTWLSRIASRV